MAAPRVAAWSTGLAAAPRVPLRTPGRRNLSASNRPRAAPTARACPSRQGVAGASVREPGDGAGARRLGMALAPGRSVYWLHHSRPKIFVLIAHGFRIFNGFPLHGRPETIINRRGNVQLRYLECPHYIASQCSSAQCLPPTHSTHPFHPPLMALSLPSIVALPHPPCRPGRVRQGHQHQR
jgi:hypothetical protein